jgi:hypothetical protein
MRNPPIEYAQGGCGIKLGSEQWIGGNHEPACAQLDWICEDCIEVTFGAGIQDKEVHPAGIGCRPRFTRLGSATVEFAGDERTLIDGFTPRLRATLDCCDAQFAKIEVAADDRHFDSAMRRSDRCP